MPMYHIGNGFNNQHNSNIGRQSFSNNNLNFGLPPQQTDFQIDGLPPELQPVGLQQPLPLNQQLSSLINHGAKVRVKKVYHLTDEEIPPTPPMDFTTNEVNNVEEEPLPPTPPGIHKSPSKMTNHIVKHPEDCNCHACEPRKFCKCPDCQIPEHGPNCPCIECRQNVPKQKSVQQQYTKNVRNSRNSIQHESIYNNNNNYSQRNNMNTRSDWNSGNDRAISPVNIRHESPRRNTFAAPTVNSPTRKYEYINQTPYNSSNRRNTGFGFNKHLKNSTSYEYDPFFNSNAIVDYEKSRRNAREDDTWSVQTDTEDRELLKRLMK